jgi:hypothetical protein
MENPEVTAARSRAPFRMPSQPSPRFVDTDSSPSSSASSTGNDSSTSTRNGHCLLRQFQGGDRLFPADRRKRVQELLERVAGLKVIEEAIHRHPSAHEDQSSAHDFGIAVDYLFRAHGVILPATYLPRRLEPSLRRLTSSAFTGAASDAKIERFYRKRGSLAASGATPGWAASVGVSAAWGQDKFPVTFRRSAPLEDPLKQCPNPSFRICWSGGIFHLGLRMLLGAHRDQSRQARSFDRPSCSRSAAPTHRPFQVMVAAGETVRHAYATLRALSHGLYR